MTMYVFSNTNTVLTHTHMHTNTFIKTITPSLSLPG